MLLRFMTQGVRSSWHHLLFNRSVVRGMTNFGEESKTSCRESPAHACQCRTNLIRGTGPRAMRLILGKVNVANQVGTAPGDAEPSIPQWSPLPDAFLGIYYIETRANLHRTAEFIALEESAGSWSGGGTATALYARSLGRVHDVREIAPGRGYAAIAYPAGNLPERGSPFAAIWLYLLAGPLFERPFADVIRLADVVLPHGILAAFRGPRFGLSATLALLRQPAAELLLREVVEPGAGLNPDEVAARRDAASGGGSALAHRPGTGIDVRVFARFARLLGGDYLDLYAQGGYLHTEAPAQTRELANVLRGPWGAIAPVLPTCSGGLTPQTLAANYETLGRDILPMAGSAIFGHALGAAAGGAAPRHARPRYFPRLPSPPR